VKIDFSQQLKDFRTGKMMFVDGTEQKLTLGFCCSESLLMPNQDVDPGLKIADVQLAEKCLNGGEVDLPPEQVARLKQKVAAAYPSPLVSGQCGALLNG
jgi:hypothetical protein